MPLETPDSGQLGNVPVRYFVTAQIGINEVGRVNPRGINGDQSKPLREVIAVVLYVFVGGTFCITPNIERRDQYIMMNGLHWNAGDDLRMTLFKGTVCTLEFSLRITFDYFCVNVLIIAKIPYRP
jgi:hypothetical protein